MTNFERLREEVSLRSDSLESNKLNNGNKRIVLNARGFRFEILLDKFAKFPPNSRLGELTNYGLLSKQDILSICDDFNFAKTCDEFYFDRDHDVLKLILNYFSTGKFHLVSSICPVYLEEELNYWKLNLDQIELCCKLEFDSTCEQINGNIKFEKEIIDMYNSKEEFKAIYLPKIREKLWSIIEKPYSSKSALVSIFTI